MLSAKYAHVMNVFVRLRLTELFESLNFIQTSMSCGVVAFPRSWRHLLNDSSQSKECW